MFSRRCIIKGLPHTVASGFGTSETTDFKREPNPPASTKIGLIFKDVIIVELPQPDYLLNGI